MELGKLFLIKKASTKVMIGSLADDKPFAKGDVCMGYKAKIDSVIKGSIILCRKMKLLQNILKTWRKLMNPKACSNNLLYFLVIRIFRRNYFGGM